MNYEFWWTLGNRIRWMFRLKPLPRRCCRVQENLNWTQVKSDFGFWKCKVCGSRHFELVVDPGKLGIKGRAL